MSRHVVSGGLGPLVASSTALLLIVAAVAPSVARANGRMPNTTQLDVSPHDPNFWVLGVTNGMAFSRDAGRTFRWLCEHVVVNTKAAFVDAQGFQGSDYRLLFGRGGELVVEGGNAAARSTDGGMTWAPMPDLPHGPHISLGTLSPSAHVADMGILPVYDITAQEGSLWQTRDAGQSWKRLALSAKEVLWSAARESPNEPGHWVALGATFFQHAGPHVAVSRDHGATWEAPSLWLREAVGPSGQFGLPDVLWHPVQSAVMVFRGTVFGSHGGLELVRTDDGGKTGRKTLGVSAEPRSMASTHDGASLFVATSDQKIWRSRDAGASWTPMRAPHANACVARVGRLVFFCGNQRDDGFSLAVSADGGDTLHRAYTLDRLRPADFPKGTPAAQQCPAQWPPFAQVVGAAQIDGAPQARGGAPTTMNGAPPPVAAALAVVDTAALAAGGNPQDLLARSPATRVATPAAPPSPSPPPPSAAPPSAQPAQPAPLETPKGGCTCQSGGAAPAWLALATAGAAARPRRRARGGPGPGTAT